MPMQSVPFESEMELQFWVSNNLAEVLPDCVFIDGFRIETPTGKGGVAHGFAFDFNRRAWYVIECELLKHGVWAHIAENMVSLILALRNIETLRGVRNRLFAYIQKHQLEDRVTRQLGTDATRLFQQLELFIEGTRPRVALFCDDADQDLRDLADAIRANVSLFRVQKFVIDGKPEYFSPDSLTPTFDAESSSDHLLAMPDFDLINRLGGGRQEGSFRRFRYYRLNDGSVVHIRRFNETTPDHFVFEISHADVEQAQRMSVTHVVFVLGMLGYAKVPVAFIDQHLRGAESFASKDGKVRGYRLRMTKDNEPKLVVSRNEAPVTLKPFFVSLQ